MDEHNHDPGDVFAIPDFWRPSKFLIDAKAGEHASFLFSELRLHDLDIGLPGLWEEQKKENVFFAIPELEFGDSEDAITAETSPEPDAPNAKQEDEEDGFDIWLFPEETPIISANFQSWDGFDSRRHVEPYTAYLTEAGPAIFDAALKADDSLDLHNEDHTVVDYKFYYSSLLALGLGRNSVMFSWDEEKHEFILLLPKVRMSGYTGQSLVGLLGTFLECGNITRFLRNYVENVYARNASPGRVALADSVSTLLATIQSQLSATGARQQSVLQLQQHFKPAHSMLTCFKRIVVNSSATRSDESMLSTIFQEIELLENCTDTLRDILLEILSRVSQPWLEFAGEWLGLQREAGLPLTKNGPGRSFVKVENKEWIDEMGLEMQEPDFVLDYDKVPAFVAPEDARSMFEVGKSLRFLREHHKDYPLARGDVIESVHPPKLQWCFEWEDIVQIEVKAENYEKDLRAAIQKYSKQSTQPASLSAAPEASPWAFKMDFFGKPEEDMQAHVLASISSFEQPLITSMPPNRFSDSLINYLVSPDLPSQNDSDNSLFAPPISLTPILSFTPLISAQARLINSTTLRVFFNSHHLRQHLTLQHSFHLFGSGTFSSRLSHALFDPDIESAERQRGVARSGGVMGLRLEGRTEENWPPASSELRLALMGVLSESYIWSQPPGKESYVYHSTPKELPGDLSFAVRSMSGPEIEACLSPDSLSALDFLRLAYHPPKPLDAVITPVILFKYDQIFKLLLRIRRMLYVVDSLPRPKIRQSNLEQRFRIEAHHFVTSIASYFFNTGISCTWRVFEKKLDQMERRLADPEYVVSEHEGLDALRAFHENVLDRMLFILLLRKRQKPVLQLLEEIFAAILLFSKLQRHVQREDEETQELYARFRKKVQVFISVCRGLAEKKGYVSGESGLDTGPVKVGGLFGDTGHGRGRKEENTIVQLLCVLEMNGYYDKIATA